MSAKDDGGPAFTPGPWRWEFNQATKCIQLCGGKPAYDMTVLCFARVGMNGATPLVLDPADPCVLVPASKFAQPQTGREHHKAWFQVIRQPDLNLISAAPDMYEALKAVAANIDRAELNLRPTEDDVAALRAQIRAALARAETP